MPEVHFDLPDGSSRTVTVPAGENVMRAAVNNDIAGIEAECGGMLTCATCHVHVAAEWYDRFPAPDIAEADLLEVVDDPRRTSRLACQLILTEELDGVRIALPEGP